MSKPLHIVLCGAHGTGKTTLLHRMVESLSTPQPFFRTLRSYWEEVGVSDFELLPRDVRTVFQKHTLLTQLKKEDIQWNEGFITDRSVLDFLSYTLISSDMSGVDLDIYTALVQERLAKYSHIIYLPIEFTAQDEALRADMKIQSAVDTVIHSHLEEWKHSLNYITVTGSVEERLEQVRTFLLY